MAVKTDQAFGAGDESRADDVTVVDPSALLSSLPARDPEAVTRRMAGRMLGAASLDALYDATKGVTSDELDGRAIEVESVEWQQYESDRGPIPQAVVAAVDLSTGEAFEFVTTATMLVTFLYQAQKLDALPFRARIAGKKTKGGNTALNFERL